MVTSIQPLCELTKTTKKGRYTDPFSLRERFIVKAQNIHGEKYKYEEVAYVNARTLVDIVCPTHGTFSQLPTVHLSGGGCQRCKYTTFSENRRRTLEDFVDKARKVHHDRYDYSLVRYVNNNTSVLIICKEHGQFSQKPVQHINKQAGCPECKRIALKGRYNRKYFDRHPGMCNMPATLYLIRVHAPGETFLKVGITTQLVTKRTRQIPTATVEILNETKSSLEQVWRLEQTILASIPKYVPQMRFRGNTECLTDNLDNITHIMELMGTL